MKRGRAHSLTAEEIKEQVDAVNRILRVFDELNSPAKVHIGIGAMATSMALALGYVLAEMEEDAAMGVLKQVIEDIKDSAISNRALFDCLDN